MARRAISWLVFAVVVLVAWAFLAPSALGGRAEFVIVDGTSMEPTYANGDLVVTRRQATYAVGDVVVYRAPGTVDFPVIHRVVDVVDGTYVTQGDNREQVDGWRPTDADVEGAAWFSVPRGGHVLRVLRQVPVALALVAGWLVLAHLKRQERREQGERADRGPGSRGGGSRIEGEVGPAGPVDGGDLPVGAQPRIGRDELARWLLSLGLDPDAGCPPGRAGGGLTRRGPVAAVRRLVPGGGPDPAAPARWPLPVARALSWALVASLVAVGGGRAADASSLKVDGGVLQTFVAHDVDPCARALGPDPCGEEG